MSDRLYRLIEVHQRIDEELSREQGRRWHDPFRIMRLKRLKLRAKDLIHRLTLKPVRS